MKTGNIFLAIPESLSEELFDELIQDEKIKIERIVSRGHTSPATGWCDQENEEWVLVLKGAAIIAFEDGDEIMLEVGSYLNIPAHKKHKVKWTTPETDTVWLAIHY